MIQIHITDEIKKLAAEAAATDTQELISFQTHTGTMWTSQDSTNLLVLGSTEIQGKTWYIGLKDAKNEPVT